MAEKSLAKDSKPPMSRRAFLLLGAGLAGAAGASLVLKKPLISRMIGIQDEARTGIDWREAPWTQIDFVNHPDLIVNNPSSDTRMSKDLFDFSESVDQFLDRSVENNRIYNLNPDFEGYKAEAMLLLDRTRKLASDYCWARDEKLSHVLPELESKYREYALHLHTILVLNEALKNVPPGDFDKQIEASSHTDTLELVKSVEDGKISPFAPNFDRSSIRAHWNFDWNSLAESTNAVNLANPLEMLFFDKKALALSSGFAETFLPRTPLNLIEKEDVGGAIRPREARFVEIDPEVAKILEQILRDKGLERAITSINIDPLMSMVTAYTFPVSGDIFLGYPLDIESYNLCPNLVEAFLWHEALHVMDGRSSGDGGTGLPDQDYYRFRNLLLELANHFDPFRNMKELFNPGGEYPELDPQSYSTALEYFNDAILHTNPITLSDYYLGQLENMYDADPYNRSIWTLTNDLRSGLMQISGVDLGRHFLDFDSSWSLEEIFSSLELQLPSMDAVSGLITRSILDNRNDIGSRKRGSFRDERSDRDFFVNKVFPYTLVHLAMYKPEEFIQTGSGIEYPGLAQNFLFYWRQELERFVRNLPTEEFVADIFAGAMANIGTGIEWEEPRKLCQEMIEILKRNGLARLDDLAKI